MTGWKVALQEIGDALDHGACPRVGNRGIVMPSEGPESLTSTDEVEKDVRSEARRSETGAGQGASGTRRPARGQGSSDASSSDVGESISADHGEAELAAVQTAYPGVRVWRQEDGFWLRIEAALLPGLRKSAVFLTGVSPQKHAVKTWGFWRHGCVAYQWIGPRHTNFPDGSVCAFEPRDATWVMGEPIVELLDLYSLWALRHLYLDVFGRWPGPQSVGYAYERIVEMREDELCGCGTTQKRYGECCAPADRSRDRIRVATAFLARINPERKPPPAILATIYDCTPPPQLNPFLDEIGYIPTTLSAWMVN